MSEPADTDFNNMENQFYEDCEALRKAEISEDRISALLNLWETFHDNYKANSLRDADRCLECLLVCTSQLVFNVNYSKNISSDSKKKLKGAIISCGNSMRDCIHRQKLLNGIGSIIENPWQATSFSNTVTGPKSKKEDASNRLWDTEGWVMLESRIDYLAKIGQKCIDRVCAVLHVLVEKGHEIFRKNGRKPISFHPYEFPYHKYVEYLEVYALLQFNNLVDTQIVDVWEPQVLLEVVSSLVKKAADPNCTRLFPKLKQWKDAGEAGTLFAKKATWRALKLPNSTLLKEFFSIWMEMSGFVDNGTEQSESESPIDEIIKVEIPCTENLYQIADVTIKLMGETSYTRLKYVELFILAMTKDITVIEALKKTQPDLKATIKEHEERLSIRYLDLTRFFKDYPRTAKDCLITAFSLHPCQKLFTFLFPSSLSETENIDIAISEDSRTIPAEYDDIKEMELENCDLKIEDDLDLGDGASDDLATVIHNPRYKGFLTLNSNEELKKVCLKLLDSKSVAVIENRTLDFVKLDYAKYKDLKSRYDPEDDGIEQGYREGDKRNRRVLQLAKRNVISGTLKKAKKIAMQRARKLPTDGSEGVRRKGRPPKSTLLGDGYHSVNSNNRKLREEISRTIPNVSLSQGPWFPRGDYGGFYTEFWHTCIRVSDPPYKERSQGRNYNHEADLLKSVKREFLQNGTTAAGSVAGGNTMRQTGSENSGSGSQSQNTEATTSGDIGNNHSNNVNSSSRASAQMSNVPFYEDPFGGPFRKVVYSYTVMTVPDFAESERTSGRNLLNAHQQESNEQVPHVVRNDKKRRNICTVSEESVTVKRSRRGPPRRSINVQSLSETDEPHENDSASNRDNENDKVVLEVSHLKSNSKEPGVDMTLSDAKTPNEEVITELAPNTEAEPLPVTPERESVFAGPFQIMATAKKAPPSSTSVSPKVAIPEKEKIPIVKESNSNLPNSKPIENRPMQKPLRTYGNNGKRRLVITRPLWQTSDDKQLEVYKSAIPVVKADVGQISSKLNLPCTSGQTTNSPINGSGSILSSAGSSHGADGSSFSETDSQATTTQQIPQPPVLTATGNPLFESSIVKDDQSCSGNPSARHDLRGVESKINIVALSGNENNEKVLERDLSRSKNVGLEITPSSETGMLVCHSEPSIDVQQVSSIGAKVSMSAQNESCNENSKISEKCVPPEPGVVDVTKNEKIIEPVCQTDKANAKPSGSINIYQNEVLSKDPVPVTLKLEEPKNVTTSKECNSNSTSSNSTPGKTKLTFQHQLFHITSLLTKTNRTAPSSPTLSVQGLNPLSKPTSTKLINSEVNLESTENPENGNKATSPEIAPSSFHSLVSNDHDVSDSSILPSSNDSATATSPISSVQASDDQHEKPGFSNITSFSELVNSSNNQNLQLTCAEDSSQICISTNDQVVSGKTLSEIHVTTPVLEKPNNLEVSSPSLMRDDMCMVEAKNVICQLLDMVEEKENKRTSTTEKTLPENDSALGERNTDVSLEKEGVQAQVLETGTDNESSNRSQVELSASDKQATAKVNEYLIGTPGSNTPPTTDNLLKKIPETKTQKMIMESQVTPEKSHPSDPEIICLDSEGEDDCNGEEKDFSQDNTVESDDDVESNSEIAQLNSRLLPHHDTFPGEENQNADNRGSSETPRPLTPVEQLEKIINDKLRRKAKRPYDEEEDRIKVGRSVINYAKQNKIRLRSLVACCVTVERLPVEELSERARNQLETCNPVKRSTRLKKKKKRIVESLKNIWQDPSSEQEMESEYSESDSDIEILDEIKKINEPNKALVLSTQPKPLRGMPQCRKRKLSNPPMQQTVQGSKILKICSTPSNDSGVSGGNGSDHEFELPSGSSTEVEDDDFEPGASSTCLSEVYPKINCNPLSPDEILVDDQVDPLAINDSDGRTYDQGDDGVINEPDCTVQAAVDEHLSNLQPEIMKSQNGDDEVNLLPEERKDEEDPNCHDDVAKENRTQESSDSDCEIIENEESSDFVGKPTQIPHRQETRRIISSSLPPSATNTNVEKRLTRSREHFNSRSTRLTTDKPQFYQCSSLSLDENSAILDANANTEDTDYLILSTSNESTKEAESVECILSNNVLQNKEDDENISCTGSMYILPDENIEDSCINEESNDSNKVMEVNTLLSTDYATTTSETILSDYGQDDHFVDKLADQQISHVTNDLENDTLTSSPQIATIPEQESCEALDAPSHEEILAVPVVNQSVEMENEEEHYSITSEGDDMALTAENDTPINSPHEETISEQENVVEPMVDQISKLSEEEKVAEADVDLSVEEVNEDRFSLSAGDDDVAVLGMDISTPIDSPLNETIPEKDTCEQHSSPLEQDKVVEPQVDLCVEEQNEDQLGLSANEDEEDVIVPDMTTTNGNTRVELEQCEPVCDECPPPKDEPASADDIITDFDTNDKNEQCNNESLHQNLLEDPVQMLQQQTLNLNEEDESVHVDIIEMLDEDLDAREEEKDDNFAVEEELSTSSEEFSSEFGDTTTGNETTHEFSINESLEVTSPPPVVDIIEAESEEIGPPPPEFIPEGEIVNKEKETCKKSPQAEESIVDLDEEGMTTQEDSSTFPEIMNVDVDETVYSVANAEPETIDSPLNPSLNEDDDQDQEWVLSSMHNMDIEEPGSPQMPVLTDEVGEFRENCWDSDDAPPLIDQFGDFT